MNGGVAVGEGLVEHAFGELETTQGGRVDVAAVNADGAVGYLQSSGLLPTDVDGHTPTPDS